MKNDLYFRCQDCGKRIQYNWQDEKWPEGVPSLRAVVENRIKTAGRPLCNACWEKEAPAVT